jgi:hypothetical protein
MSTFLYADEKKLPPSERYIAGLVEVMPLLDGLDISEKHRAILIRACAEAIVDAEDRNAFIFSHRNSGKKWDAQDITTLESVLADAPICKTYGEERVVLKMLSERLGKADKIVKTKAIELGFGQKVDYWMNREDKE